MDAPSPPNDPHVEAGFAGMTASFAVPTTAVAGDVATAAIAAYERTGALGRVAISTCVPATPATPSTVTEAPGSFAAPTASFAVPTARSATEVANAAIAAIERSGVAHMGAISTYVPATPPGLGVQESSRPAPEPVLTTSPETACAARHVCLEYLKEGGNPNRTAERVFNTSVLKDIDDSVASIERILAFRFAAAPGVLPGFTDAGLKMLGRLRSLRRRYEQRSGAEPGDQPWLEAVERASPDAKYGMRMEATGPRASTTSGWMTACSFRRRTRARCPSARRAMRVPQPGSVSFLSDDLARHDRRGRRLGCMQPTSATSRGRASHREQH